MRMITTSLCLLFTAALAFDVTVVDQAAQDKGYFDAPLHMMREDGRHDHIQSIFEYRRIQKEQVGHPMLSQMSVDPDAEYVDAFMEMMWDWNHVMAVRLHNATKDLHLIPTTGMSDMVLMHEGCEKCWSMHSAKWKPDEHYPKLGGIHANTTSKHLEYFFMMHLYDVEVSGFYWTASACLRAFQEACAKDLVFYAISWAKPWFHTLGDGYFGLAPSYGYEKTIESSLLHQIYDRGMIKSKIFGVHTHMFNTTEDPTQIRFGAFNQDLFQDGHDLLLMETRSKHSWEVKFDSAGFFSEEVWKGWHALIDPGYPFIALPKNAFEAFKQDLLKAYPDEPVTCSDDEWCYFMTPCSKIIGDMPDLKFTFPTDHGELKQVTYNIPAKSFLFNDVDPRTKLQTCHLGLVQQRFSETDHFILGSAFMENFYAVFDASNPTTNRIGFSYNVKQAVADQNGVGTVVVGVIAMVVFVALIALGIVCACMRKRRQEKIEKARTYFDSLKTGDDGEQPLEEDSRDEADVTINPNNFLKSTGDSTNEQLTSELL